MKKKINKNPRTSRNFKKSHQINNISSNVFFFFNIYIYFFFTQKI